MAVIGNTGIGSTGILRRHNVFQIPAKTAVIGNTGIGNTKTAVIGDRKCFLYRPIGSAGIGGCFLTADRYKRPHYITV